ncbi:integration host factor subunit beta [Dechloromonas sp. ARDL1]|uniref:integration host factor subunit beta n=1 Tax=Dechloromonas sp. ARDL1 TaxID=3322121 RepID=UPI003DA73FBA
MPRSELILRLAERFPQLVLKDVSISVAETLDKIGETLVDGGRVEIRGFGTFSLNHRPPRIGRNPKTGEKVSVAGKYAPHFKAGKELRDRVDLAARPALKEAA